MADEMPPHAVAIIGYSGRFPGADDLDGFWRNIIEGVETLETPTDADLDAAGVTAEDRVNANYVRRATALDGAADFDARFFDMSPREAQIVDPQHRVFLECAWEALEHAGYAPKGSEQSIGVYGGASMNTYLFQLLRDPALAQSVGRYQLMLGNDKDFLCTRVSYKLNLKGPSLTIQTACSTSLVAVVSACQAIARGECDVALAGGVSINVPERAGYLYEEGMIFSPDGHCRPFDAGAQGTRSSAGAGIVVLKRYDEAVADRDTIHAVIRGAAINNDGSDKVGFTAPSVDGQTEVIATAQALAGVRPREISYIETHGTGTSLGDPIEIAALSRAVRSSTQDVGFCRLGSLKANLGHLDAAAGVAGLIKTVLALKNKQFPPLVNFVSPNPSLDLANSPFIASARSAPWTSEGAPRRAGVSSFGIGGTNAHVVIEEARAPIARDDGSPQLLTLSAKTASALDRASARLADELSRRPELSLTDVAWTLQTGRTEFAHRRFVVAATAAEAQTRLRDPRAAYAAHAGGSRPVAFLFTGQGSQFAGMGQALYLSEPSYRDAIDACAEHLASLTPRLDIRDVLFGAARERINETVLAQPALFVTEYALARLWRQRGVSPTAMIGHSIGEYVAACLSGVMRLADALKIVALRGRLMQDCAPGAMAAVEMTATELADMLPEGIEIAAINAPALCVVSGPAQKLEAWLAKLATKGSPFTRLVTSHAFHSAMMEPARLGLASALREIPLSAPKIPFVSSLTGDWITPQQATSPDYYADQLRRPVQFLSGLKTLLSDPSLLLLEVGPGSTLHTMARLTAGSRHTNSVVSSLAHPRDRRSDPESMLEAAGRLWLAGVALDWPGFHAAGTPGRVPLPTYPFERERHWVDAPGARPLVEPAPQEDVGAWLHAPTWKRGGAVRRDPRPLSGEWIVAARAGDFASAMLKALAGVGVAPIFIEIGDEYAVLNEERVRVRSGSQSDLAAASAFLQERRRALRGAICLWDDDLGRPSREVDGYELLVSLAEMLNLAGDGREAFLAAVTFGSQSVLDETVHDLSASLAIGPVLVLPTESGALKARLIDLPAEWAKTGPDVAAETVLAELQSNDAEGLVAWRDGERWLRRYEKAAAPVEPSDLPFKKGGIYLITGGLGGMGLALGKWLAERYSARLLLTGRSGLPERAEWEYAPRDSAVALAMAGVRAIEAAGGEALAVSADAANFSQMSAAIARARARWGEINGVIHAAGVAGSGRLAALRSPEEAEAVFSPKLYGLRTLTRLLGAQNLDFVALMSSVNAIAGAPGACDYTAANAVLDAFADSRERPPLWPKVIAINWGPWRDVGMAANLTVPDSRRALWREHLEAGISSAAGAEAFARALGSGLRRVVVAPNVQSGDGNSPVSVRDREPRQTTAPQVASRAPRRPERSATATALAEIWSELLGVSDIEPDSDFFALGGHSLLATRLISRISAAFEVRMSLRDVFDAPTFGLLFSRIEQAQSGWGEPAGSEEREELIF